MQNPTVAQPKFTERFTERDERELDDKLNKLVDCGLEELTWDYENDVLVADNLIEGMREPVRFYHPKSARAYLDGWLDCYQFLHNRASEVD